MLAPGGTSLREICLILCLVGCTTGAAGDAVGETGRMVGFTEAHNQVREPLGLEPLVWNANMAAYAAQWAQELTDLGCILEHRPNFGEMAQLFGENLSWNRGFESTPAEVTGYWASEVENYDYDSNTCSDVCGHYTQIVWADTRKLGCAMATCDQGEEVWVCNYDPPGNIIGRQPY
jgi:uncharacterized protein YkwD